MADREYVVSVWAVIGRDPDGYEWIAAAPLDRDGARKRRDELREQFERRGIEATFVARYCGWRTVKLRDGARFRKEPSNA